MFNKNKEEFSPLFLLFCCLFVTCLLISNIIAGKLILVMGNVLPAAVILFPVTYIFGDILTEVYGYEKAKIAIWLGFIANVIMALFFILTVLLPYPDFWNGQEAYKTVLGLTPRLVLASLLAYIAGEFSNSYVLSKMKLITSGRWLWSRTIGSTILGEGIDTVIFITVAFAGFFPFKVIVSMIIAQYIWKVSYEIIITPITYMVIRWIKKREGVDTYDYSVDYNPFRLGIKSE